MNLHPKKIKPDLFLHFKKKDVLHLFSVLSLMRDKESFDKETQRIWDQETSNELSVDDILADYQESQMLLKKLKKQESGRTYYKYVVGIAASIAVLFLSGLGWMEYTQNTTAVSYAEVSTSIGERRTLVLEDGSVIQMNACSSVKYPLGFSQSERIIELQGEAFFEVAKDKNRPFIVRTEQLQVKVLGTSFNVRSYSSDENIAVQVHTGLVNVNVLDASLNLSPNEKLTVNTLTHDIFKTQDDLNGASWVKGKLWFNGATIQEVATELERQYDCKIILEQGCDFTTKISGGHDNKTLVSVLDAIEAISDVKYTMKGNNTVYFHK